MTRVLVTGAAGFLGSSLVTELSRSGYGVRAVLHDMNRSPSFLPEIETMTADIRDFQKIKEATAGCEAIVHLAAKVHDLDDGSAERDYDAINVEGTRHVLEAAAASGVARLVFASSVKVFGEETRGCVDESQAPDPRTPYGRSKWRAEQQVAQYAGRNGLTTVSLRLPMVYGPTKKGNLYRMIDAIDRGLFPPLPPLSTVRSLLHVDNFVQAVLLCLKAPRLERPAYIVTDAEPYRVTDVYDWLRAGLGKPRAKWRVPLRVLTGIARCGDLLQTITGGRPPLTSEQLLKLIGGAWYSSAAITRELGYRAVHSLEKAVPELIAHYRGASQAGCR